MPKSKLRNMHQYWDSKTNQFLYTFKETYDEIFKVYDDSGQYYEAECQDYVDLTLELMAGGTEFQFYISWNEIHQHWFTLKVRHPDLSIETHTITIDDLKFNHK